MTRMDLSFLIGEDESRRIPSLPGEGDTVTVYAPNATQTIRIRRVLSKTRPFDKVVVLTVEAEIEPCGDDSDAE